jgi:glycosyltransferase involved in cell wall biosynthesis
VKTPSICMIAYTDFSCDARVRREAQTLASNGFRVTCLTTKNGDQPSRLRLDDVEVRELNVKRYQGKSAAAYIWSYLRFLTAASAAITRLMLAGEVDVVHAHNLPDFLVFAGLLPRIAGKKVVLDVHDSVPETFATKFAHGSLVRRMLCFEERISAAVAHKVICVNDPQRQTLVARGLSPAKTFISMNVPDPRIFAPVNGLRPHHAGDFNLVYHGTMAERLGVDLVIRAVGELRERLPCLQLHLWGGGDDLPKFQRLVGELGLQDRVHFKSKIGLSELPSELGPMHLGVIGNRRNIACDLMLPVKLMEYVALGIPAVAPRLRTIEHYFSDDMVGYYEAENVSAMADAILQMCVNPELRQRRAEAARRFLAEYGWERQGAELVTFYRRLVEA